MTDFQDSTDDSITYKRIRDRAIDDAKGYLPDFPKTNTFEAWESFQQGVEALDAYEIAHESSGWDWVIYLHKAMELCQAVPIDVLHDAESEWVDMDSYTDSQFGLYEFASVLAGIIVTREIADAVESLKEEMIDLAQTQMENL